MKSIEKMVIYGMVLIFILIIGLIIAILSNKNSQENKIDSNIQISNSSVEDNIIQSHTENNVSDVNNKITTPVIEENRVNNEIIATQEPDLLENVEISNKIKESNYEKVNNCIQTYIAYIKENNLAGLEGTTGSRKNILDLNILQSTTIKIDDIYEVSNLAGSFYYVHLRSSIGEDDYIIVNMDYTNYAFKIIKSEEEEFNKAKNMEINNKYKSYIKVMKNKYNEIVKK